MSVKLLSLDFFPTFSNRDEFLQRVTSEEAVWSRVSNQYVMLILLSFVYGAVMDVYHSVLQALAAGAKMLVLFTLVLVVCFPAFFIIQYILGSKLKLAQMVSIILSGFVLTAAIMVSFTPIVIFFLLTGSNYYFLQLLHIAIVVLSGVFGMKTIVDALKYSCEKKNIYPQMGVVVFRFWVVIMAFVGIQLAWNLRPFLGDRNQSFALFREYEGNFYAALIYSANQLLDPTDRKEPSVVSRPHQERYLDDRAVEDSLAGFFAPPDKKGDNGGN